MVNHNLHNHRSFVKNIVIPYLSSVYKLKILDSKKYPPGLMLSAAVLDNTVAVCHKQWTTRVRKKIHFHTKKFTFIKKNSLS